MLQFQQAAQLTLYNLSLVVAMVFGIFHHVLHALHLRAHLDDGLRGVHDGVHRLQERAHESLEGHEHTHRQVAL